MKRKAFASRTAGWAKPWPRRRCQQLSARSHRLRTSVRVKIVAISSSDSTPSMLASVECFHNLPCGFMALTRDLRARALGVPRIRRSSFIARASGASASTIPPVVGMWTTIGRRRGELTVGLQPVDEKPKTHTGFGSGRPSAKAMRFATAIIPMASRTSRQAVPRCGSRVTFCIATSAAGTSGSNS